MGKRVTMGNEMLKSFRLRDNLALENNMNKEENGQWMKSFVTC